VPRAARLVTFFDPIHLKETVYWNDSAWLSVLFFVEYCDIASGKYDTEVFLVKRLAVVNLFVVDFLYRISL
jgi:hypothetical protein